MVAMRKRAQADARQAWRQIDPADLSGTYPVGMLALTVATLQREAARLSGGYLKAFIDSELGVTDTPIPLIDATMVGDARNGDNLRTALMSPLIGVKVGIRDGKSPEQALAEGRSALERMVGLATDTAARESLHRAMSAAPEVVGWRRAVGGTCGACMGDIKSEMVDTETPLKVHPNCKCVAEPVVEGPTGDPDALLGHAKDLPESDAFDQYVNVAYSGVNGMLRDDLLDLYRDVRPDLVDVVDSMDKAFRRLKPLDQPIETWRGVPQKAEELFPGLGDDIIGKAITDAGYGSTSANVTVARASARAVGEAPGDVWHLKVRPGVKALRLGDKESEVLLDRGRKYVITGVRKEKGLRVIEAEVT